MVSGTDQPRSEPPQTQAVERLWRALLGTSLNRFDADSRRRSRLCGVLALVMLGITLLIGLSRLSQGMGHLALPSLIHAVSSAGTIWLLRRGAPVAAANLLCGALVLTMSANNLLTFGRLPGAYLGGGVIVILSVLLTGPRAGGGWTGLLATSMFAATALDRSGLQPLVAVSLEYRLGQWHTTGAVVCLLAGLAALVYEHLHSRSLRELEHARRAAAASAEAKGTFLATMSHEIRTPLNGVHGIAQLLRGRELDEGTQALVDRLLASSSALLSVVNAVLELSKIEASAVVLERSRLDLRALCQEAVGMFQAHPPTERVALSLEFRGPDVCVVLGDQTRLRQVLTNLVGNAVKFTAEGSVVLRVVAEPQPEEQLAVHFSVIDTGIGIPKAALPQLFDSFRQADSSTTRRFGGPGLGLSISQHLVGLMGGEITVERW